MDEDEKIEMRGNQHRTKPSFGIMQEGEQTRAKGITEESRWTDGHGRVTGRAWLLDSGPNCIWILHGMV